MLMKPDKLLVFIIFFLVQAIFQPLRKVAHGFRRMLEIGAVEIVMPDLQKPAGWARENGWLICLINNMCRLQRRLYLEQWHRLTSVHQFLIFWCWNGNLFFIPLRCFRKL